MDTSKYGLGRCNLGTGRTWNYKLFKGIINFTTINHLEFLAFLVQILLGQYDKDLDNKHILGWLDNMTAIYWLKQQPRLDAFTN